jgi:23S rRNA (uracil1939-C5)-methyltransferase
MCNAPSHGLGSAGPKGSRWVMTELSIGSRCDVMVSDLSQDGAGIGRCGEAVVFVPGALPQERVLARLVHKGQRHWLSQLDQVLVASPERRRPPCSLASSCGGCSLQHLAPAAQARWKGDHVAQALQRIAAINHPVAPLMAAPIDLGYRNRAIIPLERRSDGQVRGGYYRRGSHRIVNLNQCPVLDPRIDALVEPIKADLAATDWPIDRDGHNGGGLRHLALRLGRRSGEMQITLISSHDRLPGLGTLARQWTNRWDGVVGVSLNLQPEATNVLMGPQTRLISGRATVRERFADLEFTIASDTFFQVFTEQAERVVPLLLDVLASADRPGLAIDAYCGIGTYSLPLAAAGWQVLGLEINPRSVDLAQRNAKANGLEQRCAFAACDVAGALAEHLPGADLLFIDPPRRGLDQEVVATILSATPRRLVYLSCNPATLARDLKPLVSSGRMELLLVQPIDFFPHTTHVETLVVLRRRP